MVFVNSKSLSSLKIDDTPVDDPSLKVLVANNSDTLKLLKMSSCPHVSPAGTVSARTAAAVSVIRSREAASSCFCFDILKPYSPCTFTHIFYLVFLNHKVVLFFCIIVAFFRALLIL